MSTEASATDVTVTLVSPVLWNWAEAATDQWTAAAKAAGLDVEVVSEEVDHPDTDAAIVRVDGEEYVLEVRHQEVRATPAHEA